MVVSTNVVLFPPRFNMHIVLEMMRMSVLADFLKTITNVDADTCTRYVKTNFERDKVRRNVEIKSIQRITNILAPVRRD